MTPLEEKIIQKARSFRDASVEMSMHVDKWMDLHAMHEKAAAAGQNTVPMTITEFLDSHGPAKEVNAKTQAVTRELFELIDELDVVEGKGVQR